MMGNVPSAFFLLFSEIEVFQRTVKKEKNKKEKQMLFASAFSFGAGDEARTRYLHLGKVALYRMSYTRRNMMYYNSFSEKVKSFFS